MSFCPECRAEIAEDREICPECGQRLSGTGDVGSDGRSGGRSREPSNPTLELPSGGSSGSQTKVLSRAQAILRRARHEPRFVPGTLLMGRYRIIGLLGEGGMGEVYRADDLKLQEPVALKFLPEGLTQEEPMLERFHREVRIAHQISHPNVCRVYDIGEVDGQHFISMEYIDGENLASLLRRIGHLPPAKALQIAHQLTAGLAAAHSCGVLHRDLKPGNVMIDGRGRAKITDFGLASLIDEIQGEKSRAGTPPYMAPEQILEQNVSVQSDIYSLGLVLFEVFTGEKAFPGGEREIKLEKGLEPVPRSPSSILEVDPEVERVLLRCLQHDPLERPVSVIALAAALPGGDPLAAALAAGETPSPEMVAAAPKEGSLTPAVALVVLAGVFLELLVLALLSGPATLHRRVPLDKPPAVLVDRAGELVRELGFGETLEHDAHGFREDAEVRKFLGENEPPAERWAKLEDGRAAAIYFWYRSSARPIVPVLHGFWRADYDDPPATPRSTRLFFDPRGRLLAFQAFPDLQPATGHLPSRTGSSRTGSSDGGPQAGEPGVDWEILFAAAGLDPKEFKPATPRRRPHADADFHDAWEGTFPEHDVPVRVEAASLAGRPISFEVLAPWSEKNAPWNRPIRLQPVELEVDKRAFQQLLVLLFFSILLASLILARRNLQNGRGDRKGAFRFALFLFVLSIASWLLWTSHVASFLELTLFIEASALALFRSTLFWIIYVALEPFVRRRWPQRIISWSRLLAGQVRDPLVGRDLLIGALFGLGMLIVIFVGGSLPGTFDLPTDLADFVDADALVGLSGVVRQLNEHVFIAVLIGLSSLFALLLLTMLLQKEAAATVVFWLLLTLVWNLALPGGPMLRIALGMAAAMLVFVLRRFGLLAVASGLFFYLTCRYYPITSDLGAWYAESAIWAFLVVTVPVIFGFYTSLAGQPILRRGLLEERASGI